jgi:hypothetical protein
MLRLIHNEEMLDEEVADCETCTAWIRRLARGSQYITAGFNAVWFQTRPIRNHSIAERPCATLIR